MTLGELTSVFSNDTNMELLLLCNNNFKKLYTGCIYGYSKILDESYPDNLFKSFDVVNAEVLNNTLKILIED